MLQAYSRCFALYQENWLCLKNYCAVAMCSYLYSVVVHLTVFSLPFIQSKLDSSSGLSFLNYFRWHPVKSGLEFILPDFKVWALSGTLSCWCGQFLETKLNFALEILPISLAEPNLQEQRIERIVLTSLVPQYLALASTSAWASPVNRHPLCPVRRPLLTRIWNLFPPLSTFCSLES